MGGEAGLLTKSRCGWLKGERPHRIGAGPDDNQPGCSQEGVMSMCDYSLDFVASRPAKIGDKLVTTKFKNSVTRGFAAILSGL
jgi:hypothetical protein